ncbi:MAG: alpha/beta hydrolase [Chthoniobacter sp.]|uniref:alpha/beta hydrolase n=1 Tax=Chthoniobacter sp. TaxID=2510640 RepID=UPI0032AA85E8
MKSLRLRLLLFSAAMGLFALSLALPLAVQAQQTAAADRPKELPDDAKALMDLSYVENGHARQKLDLYLPAQPKGPLLVWIHGGGWRGGSKDKPPGLALVKNGVAVASVEYRFSQDAVFPAQIEDCKAAIRWLRAHAKEYGYRDDMVAAWGASAGGHLVALLAVTGKTHDFDVGANLDQSSAIQCGLDWFGPSDFPAYDPDLPEPMVQRENPESVIALLFGGPVSQKLELAKRASPVTWVTKDAAPLLIMQGTKDPLVPFDQSQRLYDKLKAAGADVTLDVIEGAGHGGPQFTTEEKLKLMFNFLAKHWAGKP